MKPVYTDAYSTTPLTWGWSASKYSLEHVEACTHNFRLLRDPDGDTHIILDRYCMGLGGYDSWSPNVREDYLVLVGGTLEGSVLMEYHSL